MTSPQCATGFGKNTIRCSTASGSLPTPCCLRLLGVSRRTTQDYRDRGLLPYYRLDGKILYAEEDIEIFLQSNYRPKFDWIIADTLLHYSRGQQ